MKTKIAALLTALFFAFALPASAGNNTNDFYLKKSCSPAAYINFQITNWDLHSSQAYHYRWDDNNSTWRVTGVYQNGYYVSSAQEYIGNWPGHYPYTWTIQIYNDAYRTYYSCSVRL